VPSAAVSVAVSVTVWSAVAGLGDAVSVVVVLTVPLVVHCTDPC
jgi:hypothetical protein